MPMRRRVVIVGAGIFGLTCAQRLASQTDCRITVIEKRNHIGGNCWSEKDEKTGIECHKYGSHIFHTSNERVWKYISGFTRWNNYRHSVWTNYDGKVYPMPINLETINKFFDANMDPESAKKFIEKKSCKSEKSANFEEKAISLVGEELYRAFIYGYTLKQWQKQPNELPAEILKRIPLKFNYDTHYFLDKWEGIPLDGYANLFMQMIDKKNIEILLNTEWQTYKKNVDKDDLVIFSGPIDEYYDFRLGELEWRSLKFESEKYPFEDYQGTSVMNYANHDKPYTRIHEFKHFHPERKYSSGTIIYKEYSLSAKAGEERYYPIPTNANINLYQHYKLLSRNENHVFFGGRLGSYAYLDMDDVVAEALNLTDRLITL